MRKKSKEQLEDEKVSADRRRHLAEIKFILESLSEEDRVIAELMYHARLDEINDHGMARLAALKPLTPAERSVLVAAWREELQHNQLKQ